MNSQSVDLKLDHGLESCFTKDQIFEVNDCVQSFFLRALGAAEGEGARRHLVKERGLPNWLIEEEGFGYLGEGRTRVVDFACEQKIPLELCAEAGLIKRSDAAVKRAFRREYGRDAETASELAEFFRTKLQGRRRYYYDYPILITPNEEYRHGDWLTIPIRVLDDHGRVRIGGFQYRSMRPVQEIGQQGRYRSPRPTAALSWTQTLIGLAEEAPQIARSGWVVIVEGKFDQAALKVAVRSLSPDERPGVIALGGVATRGQGVGDTPEARAGVLGKIGAERVTLFTDADERGVDAVLVLGALFASLGSDVTVGRLSDAWVGTEMTVDLPKDPGEVLARLGEKALFRALDRARSRGLGDFASVLLEERLAAIPYSGQLWRRLSALDRVAMTVRALAPERRDDAVRRIARAAALPDRVVRMVVEGNSSSEVHETVTPPTASLATRSR